MKLEELLDTPLLQSIPDLSAETATLLDSLDDHVRTQLEPAVESLHLRGFAAYPFQAEAAASVIAGKDTIVNTATTSGKTMVVALWALACPGVVRIVFFPLKFLQVSMVSALPPISRPL